MIDVRTDSSCSTSSVLQRAWYVRCPQVALYGWLYQMLLTSPTDHPSDFPHKIVLVGPTPKCLQFFLLCSLGIFSKKGAAKFSRCYSKNNLCTAIGKVCWCRLWSVPNCLWPWNQFCSSFSAVTDQREWGLHNWNGRIFTQAMSTRQRQMYPNNIFRCYNNTNNIS